MKEFKKEAAGIGLTGISFENFKREIISGLKAELKSLPSKYFYDAEGDKLFQQIMASDEYYLTRCEMEIFTKKTDALVSLLTETQESFDVIELGAGDGTKTIHLLKHLTDKSVDFRYLPIDISENALTTLTKLLQNQLPGIDITTLKGEYLEMLQEVSFLSDRRKLVLFLGSNIGNFNRQEAVSFCKKIRTDLQVGDIFVMGFDLMKNPNIIRAAYDDKMGITKAFNLNLLRRINRELGADFNLNQFEHYSNYDPETGACKSYLVSLQKQIIHFPEDEISLEKDEIIWMEISQKYSRHMITDLAVRSGFEVSTLVTDSKNWFADAVLKAV